MRERPILMNGEMVRATLEGRKGQTRRVVTPQPAPFVQCSPDRHEQKHPEPYIDSYCSEKRTPENPRGMSDFWCWWTRDDRQGPDVGRCPYGHPGDRLWVRETWRTGKSLDALNTTAMSKLCADAGYTHPWAPLLYMADGRAANEDTLRDFGGEWGRTRQSIYMPRWASRLTLDVTGVRVERLQSISEEDAQAEGATPFLHNPEGDCWDAAPQDRKHRTAFNYLWGTINGFNEGDAKRPGCSWDANPYVWVIEFKAVHRG